MTASTTRHELQENRILTFLVEYPEIFLFLSVLVMLLLAVVGFRFYKEWKSVEELIREKKRNTHKKKNK